MAISSHRNRACLEKVPQIGDRVRVKDLKDILNITGPGRVYKYHNGRFATVQQLYFQEEMDCMCGREYFVEGIDKYTDTVYLVDAPKQCTAYPWWFHYDFLEEV